MMNLYKRRKSSECGYSLVEISLAVLVLAVGLVSILSVFPVALKWSGDAAANTVGSLAAQTAVADIAATCATGSWTHTKVNGDTWDYGWVGTAGANESYYIILRVDGYPTSTPEVFKFTLFGYKKDINSLPEEAKREMEQHPAFIHKAFVYVK